MRRIIAFIITLLIAASAASAELPAPEKQSQQMILGEQTGGYYTDLELFYESGNGLELSTVTRAVYVPEGETVIEAALKELFKPTDDQGFLSPMPGDASIRNISYGCGLVTVDLAINIAGLQSEAELVSMFKAVTNTLAGIDGVEYVNILVNTRQESICSLPAGVLLYNDNSTAATWAQYQADSAGFFDSNMPIERNAALYFPSSNGQWLLTEVRSIAFKSDNYAEELLLALINGATGGSAYVDFLSGGSSILAEAPALSVDSTGQRVLDISLSNTVRDYMILQGINEWQLAGAVTLTMCSFIPELDAVRLSIGGSVIDRLNIRGQYHDFDGGLMHRNDFSMYPASICTLYFAGDSGKLAPVKRAISSERCSSAYTLLTQLVSGPSSADGVAASVMPAGMTASDILGVTVQSGTAIVNFTDNFYRLCQMMNETEERLLIYSIVNTLCDLPGISSVKILIEGDRIETLSGTIYLIDELLPNPGFIE